MEINVTDNLQLYDYCRVVPQEAQKEIKAGRLKGKTDINPLWRIKTLTEMFGPVGTGWRTANENYITQRNEATGEVAVICTLNLLYRTPDGWSDPVFGVGGSMLIALENMYDANGQKVKGLYLNDEAYKMAHTDALSVACKQLGMGASVYWSEDNTKYTGRKQDNEEPPKPGVKAAPATINKAQTPAAPMQKTSTIYNPWPEVNKIKERFNVNDDGFNSMRMTLVAGGIIPNIPSKEMTEADWKQLFEAIEKNFGDCA